MTPHHILDILRRRWRTLVLATVLGVAIAVGTTLVSARIYSAQTDFFVSTADSDNAATLQQGNSFTQQRVKSYAQLLDSPKVLQPVIDELKLSVTPDELAKKFSTTVPLDTVLIEVRVVDRDREQAQRIARALGATFPSVIASLERVNAQGPTPVKVTVIKDGEAAAAPISPRPLTNLVLGTALGLLAGLALALLRDRFDVKVKTSADIEKVTDLPILGLMTEDPDASLSPLIVWADPRSQRTEEFRALRTNLQFIDVAHPPRSIVVTSALSGEGKTTTAANLALTLGDIGKSVVVIEGDLRRPRLLEHLGMEGSVGLTDVLIKSIALDEALQDFGSLKVLGSGHIPPNPSELLGSAVMSDLLRELEDRFDYVIIDSPPLLPVTDAAVLSTVVSGALLVVGAGTVTRDQVDAAIGALEAVNGSILGVVLNRIDGRDTVTYGYPAYHEDHGATRRYRRQHAISRVLRHPRTR